MWKVTSYGPGGEVQSTSHRMLHQTTEAVNSTLSWFAKLGLCFTLTKTPTKHTYKVRGYPYFVEVLST